MNLSLVPSNHYVDRVPNRRPLGDVQQTRLHWRSYLLHDILLALSVLACNLNLNPLLRPSRRPVLALFLGRILFKYFIIHFTSLIPLLFAHLSWSTAPSSTCLLSAIFARLKALQTANPASCTPLLHCLPSSCSVLPPRKTAPAPSTPPKLTRPRRVSGCSSEQLHIADHHPLDQWCITEKNTCGQLCGGLKYAKINECDNVGSPLQHPLNNPHPTPSTLETTLFISPIPATKANTPHQMSLNFTCLCQNGQTPTNLAQYQQTLPFLECQFTFIKCNTAYPGSSQCSNNCGNLDPTTVKEGAGAAPTSSAAASSTASATSTGATSSASPAKGAAGRYVPEAGFAAAVVGAMGMLL